MKLWSDAHRRTPIDIFVYEPFNFAAEAAQMVSTQILPDLDAPVVSLSTLLEMKRAAGRPQDLLDSAELQRAR